MYEAIIGRQKQKTKSIYHLHCCDFNLGEKKQIKELTWSFEEKEIISEKYFLHSLGVWLWK